MEWTIVTVIIALAGLMATVGAPVIKLNGTIVKLNATIEAMDKRLGTVEAQALWTEVISTAAPAGAYGLVLLQNTAAVRFAFPVNNADTIYQHMVMAPGAPGGALSMGMSGAMAGAYTLEDGSGGSVFQ